MEWEWSTGVFVVKEGNFTRSGMSEVDEAEIFEGGENKLTMTQAYTWEFQCNYKLQKYPFDTQVNMIQILEGGYSWKQVEKSWNDIENKLKNRDFF